jgi:D-glycero-D-manno-heptose 1,7-bisphosphate phosphatase
MGQVNRAVFLDRDGVIIEDNGFIDHRDRVKLLPRAAEAIKILNSHQYKVIVVTNQSGVARGLFSEKTVVELSDYMLDQLLKLGAIIDRVYYCPHHPDGTVPGYGIACRCRKPDTGMVEQATLDFNLDLKRSFVIGDNASDIELGTRAGCHTVLVTGYGTRRNASGEPRGANAVVPDLYAAAQWVVKHSRKDE